MIPLPARERRPSFPSQFFRTASEPAFIPAAGRAEGAAGNGNSWHSRSWRNTHCHRAGPAGSSHSWPAPADRCTLRWAPWAGPPPLQNRQERVRQILTCHLYQHEAGWGFTACRPCPSISQPFIDPQLFTNWIANHAFCFTPLELKTGSDEP